ncbi:MAG TPA: hypothetical protein VMQ62_05135 [Dongiaceae bacterium]|nr:hypothetical protein [Dongiaceae bacterium]
MGKSLQEQYTDDMHDRFGGYFAAWTPGSPLAVGDVGVLDGNAFTRLSTLKEKKVPFSVLQDSSSETIGPFVSDRKTSVSFKASGTVSPPNSKLSAADAGFSIQFARDYATVFVAQDCRQPSIEDQLALEPILIDLYEKGEWNKGWHVVSQVVNAKSCTVFVSQSKQGAIDLKVNGPITAPNAPLIDLGSASAQLSITWSQNLAVQMVTKPATPLVKLVHLKGLFGKRLATALAAPHAAAMDFLTPEMIRSDKKLRQLLRLVEAG